MAKRAEGERTVLVVVLMLGEEAVEVVMGVVVPDIAVALLMHG